MKILMNLSSIKIENLLFKRPCEKEKKTNRLLEKTFANFISNKGFIAIYKRNFQNATLKARHNGACL